MERTLSGGKVVSVSTEEIGERFARYRVVSSQAVELMRQSLERCGQIAPVVLCDLSGRLELVDGFKRLQAARSLDIHPVHVRGPAHPDAVVGGDVVESAAALQGGIQRLRVGQIALDQLDVKVGEIAPVTAAAHETAR